MLFYFLHKTTSSTNYLDLYFNSTYLFKYLNSMHAIDYILKFGIQHKLFIKYYWEKKQWQAMDKDWILISHAEREPDD